MNITSKSNALSSLDLKGVKAILMDFDNTFYEYDPCHRYAMEKVFERVKNEFNWSIEDFKKKYKEAQEVVKARIPHQAASHSRLLYFQNLLEMQSGKTMPSLTLELEDLYWQSFITKMSLKPEVMDFVKICREKGIKICVVTDMTVRIQLKKIKHLSLEDKIDMLVTSEEAGIEKPSEIIFKVALEKMGAKPEETIMIGDHGERDKEGAEKAGIRAIII